MVSASQNNRTQRTHQRTHQRTASASDVATLFCFSVQSDDGGSHAVAAAAAAPAVPPAILTALQGLYPRQEQEDAAQYRQRLTMFAIMQQLQTKPAAGSTLQFQNLESANGVQGMVSGVGVADLVPLAPTNLAEFLAAAHTNVVAGSFSMNDQQLSLVMAENSQQTQWIVSQREVLQWVFQGVLYIKMQGGEGIIDKPTWKGWLATPPNPWLAWQAIVAKWSSPAKGDAFRNSNNAELQAGPKIKKVMARAAAEAEASGSPDLDAGKAYTINSGRAHAIANITFFLIECSFTEAWPQIQALLFRIDKTYIFDVYAKVGASPKLFLALMKAITDCALPSVRGTRATVPGGTQAVREALDEWLSGNAWLTRKKAEVKHLDVSPNWITALVDQEEEQKLADQAPRILLQVAASVTAAQLNKEFPSTEPLPSVDELRAYIEVQRKKKKAKEKGQVAKKQKLEHKQREEQFGDLLDDAGQRAIEAAKGGEGNIYALQALMSQADHLPRPSSSDGSNGVIIEEMEDEEPAVQQLIIERIVHPPEEDQPEEDQPEDDQSVAEKKKKGKKKRKKHSDSEGEDPSENDEEEQKEEDFEEDFEEKGIEASPEPPEANEVTDSPLAAMNSLELILYNMPARLAVHVADIRRNVIDRNAMATRWSAVDDFSTVAGAGELQPHYAMVHFFQAEISPQLLMYRNFIREWMKQSSLGNRTSYLPVIYGVEMLQWPHVAGAPAAGPPAGGAPAAGAPAVPAAGSHFQSVNVEEYIFGVSLDILLDPGHAFNNFEVEDVRREVSRTLYDYRHDVLREPTPNEIATQDATTLLATAVKERVCCMMLLTRAVRAAHARGVVHRAVSTNHFRVAHSRIAEQLAHQHGGDGFFGQAANDPPPAPAAAARSAKRRGKAAKAAAAAPAAAVESAAAAAAPVIPPEEKEFLPLAVPLRGDIKDLTNIDFQGPRPPQSFKDDLSAWESSFIKRKGRFVLTSFHNACINGREPVALPPPPSSQASDKPYNSTFWFQHDQDLSIYAHLFQQPKVAAAVAAITALHPVAAAVDGAPVPLYSLEALRAGLNPSDRFYTSPSCDSMGLFLCNFALLTGCSWLLNATEDPLPNALLSHWHNFKQERMNPAPVAAGAAAPAAAAIWMPCLIDFFLEANFLVTPQQAAKKLVDRQTLLTDHLAAGTQAPADFVIPAYRPEFRAGILVLRHGCSRHPELTDIFRSWSRMRVSDKLEQADPEMWILMQPAHDAVEVFKVMESNVAKRREGWLLGILQSLKLKEYPVQPSGNCLYHALRKGLIEMTDAQRSQVTTASPIAADMVKVSLEGEEDGIPGRDKALERVAKQRQIMHDILKSEFGQELLVTLGLHQDQRRGPPPEGETQGPLLYSENCDVILVQDSWNDRLSDALWPALQIAMQFSIQRIDVDSMQISVLEPQSYTVEDMTVNDIPMITLVHRGQNHWNPTQKKLQGRHSKKKKKEKEKEKEKAGGSDLDGQEEGEGDEATQGGEKEGVEEKSASEAENEAENEAEDIVMDGESPEPAAATATAATATAATAGSRLARASKGRAIAAITSTLASPQKKKDRVAPNTKQAAAKAKALHKA